MDADNILFATMSLWLDCIVGSVKVDNTGPGTTHKKSPGQMKSNVNICGRVRGKIERAFFSIWNEE